MHRNFAEAHVKNSSMRFWIGVASKEHVLRGVEGGFVQVCHGKAGPLKIVRPFDWIIYYSPTLKFQEKQPCRSFTAIGRIQKGDPYPFQMSEDFTPYRRDVHFISSKDAPIAPLIDSLSFIKDKSKWGFPFRRGCFSIPEADFKLIASHMLEKVPHA